MRDKIQASAMRILVMRNLRWIRWGAALLILFWAHIGSGQQADIQTLVTSGNLEEMRWPNFSDYRSSIQEFYGPTGFDPAWVQGSQPLPQALSLIELFRNAWSKGFDPEDYDASRWEQRIGALQGSAGAVARFDVALTVCTMRYLSNLRIGRINPRHFKFGLDIEHKKYDLAQFLRAQIVTASDPKAVFDKVEPPFAGYRRTEQALARYIDLARNDDGEKLPAVTKPVDPGQAYLGTPRLARLLQLVGDLPANATLPTDAQTYEGQLVEAVRHFQRRHGLDADGRLGPSTIKQLNVPLHDRVLQLQLTL